jgi:predicted CoA-substrate-specific enzyme activase
MNDKCAAGTGRFLEVIAEALGVPLSELGELGLSASSPAIISNTCTVFAEQEVISQLATGESVPNLIAGVHDAVATRIFALVSKLKIERDVAVTGGGAKNIGLVKALEARIGYPVLVPEEPLLTGALGAALVGKEACEAALRMGQPVVRCGKRLEEATFFS